MGAKRQREIQQQSLDAANKQIETFRAEQKQQQAILDRQKAEYKRFEFVNPYRRMENPFAEMQNAHEDLRVSTKAADYQRDMLARDQSNILSGLRGAAGGSGIASLAQMLAGKGIDEQRRISADLSQQERQNDMARAQASSQLQQLQAQGAAQADLAERGGAATVQAAEFGREATLLGMEYGGQAGANAAVQQAYANQMSAWGQAAQMQSARIGMWGSIVGGIASGVSGGIAGSQSMPWNRTPKDPSTNCFMGDCKVKMFDGSVKPIKDVKTGDKVVNTYGDKEVVINSIVHNINDVISIYTNGTVKATNNHPLFVDNKWTDAESLGWERKSMFINKLYNLEVEGYTGAFIIGDIIASGVVEKKTVSIDKI